MPAELVTRAQLDALLKPKRSKFGVDQSESGRAARTYREVVFDSLAEMRYAQELDLKKRTGVIADWLRQVRVPLVVEGVKVAAMVIDYKIFFKDGRVEYHEFKGFETPVYKLKLRLFKALYPNDTYRLVKAR